MRISTVDMRWRPEAIRSMKPLLIAMLTAASQATRSPSAMLGTTTNSRRSLRRRRVCSMECLATGRRTGRRLGARVVWAQAPSVGRGELLEDAEVAEDHPQD